MDQRQRAIGHCTQDDFAHLGPLIFLCDVDESALSLLMIRRWRVIIIYSIYIYILYLLLLNVCVLCAFVRRAFRGLTLGTLRKWVVR